MQKWEYITLEQSKWRVMRIDDIGTGFGLLEKGQKLTDILAKLSRNTSAMTQVPMAK